jgi:hypothetical protein
MDEIDSNTRTDSQLIWNLEFEIQIDIPGPAAEVESLREMRHCRILYTYRQWRNYAVLAKEVLI